MEASDDVGFALDPAGVVRGGAGERGVEDLLVGLAEATDIDDEGVLAGDGKLTESEAECPGDVVIECGKGKFFFLDADRGNVVGEWHVEVS